jgi:hypothetical protein
MFLYVEGPNFSSCTKPGAGTQIRGNPPRIEKRQVPSAALPKQEKTGTGASDQLLDGAQNRFI